MIDSAGRDIKVGDTVKAYFAMIGRTITLKILTDETGTLWAAGVGKIQLAELLKTARWVMVEDENPSQ
ncbi:MAG: hypothetical protein QMD85_03755 [Candidatus Aenigmarchaeota archaeon]|nr:hypothetical protein [Candidatus Aenigmarchaeota archaeon]